MKKQNTLLLIIWVVYPVFFIVLLIFCFFTCGNNQKDAGKVQPVEKLEKPIPQQKFRMVDIPREITNPDERLNYLIENYWTNFDFSDTTYIRPRKTADYIIANYIDILHHADLVKVDKSLKSTLCKAESNIVVYTYFLDVFRRYLYDPNSPMRNSEVYISVLEHIIASPLTSEAERVRARFDLKMLSKNRLGEMAADFDYTLLSGKSERMHSIKSEYTLLMFYNPDCHACGEVILSLKSSPIIQKALDHKILSILAFYPDADIEIWRKHLQDIPFSWINGYDKKQTVEKQQLYDLKAIPTLYLLDTEKCVLLKDVDFAELERWFQKVNLD